MAANKELYEMQVLSNSSEFVNNVQVFIIQDTLDQMTQAMIILAQNTVRDNGGEANLVTINTNVAA